jgi:mannose-6-phosphate isomerase-like protein (cupin superfamily)
VTYETGSRDADIHQQVWMLAGRMRVSMGEDSWDLATGDCLGMRLNRPTSFHNPGHDAARYLVAVVSLPYAAGTAER